MSLTLVADDDPDSLYHAAVLASTRRREIELLARLEEEKERPVPPAPWRYVRPWTPEEWAVAFGCIDPYDEG